MSKNKEVKQGIENFVIEKWKRTDFDFAEYNPRYMEDYAKKALRSKMRKYGRLTPVVVNKRTGNLVSGHQRIEQEDKINKTLDYVVTCSVIDVPLEEEVKINVMLNNPDLQGKYDPDMFIELVKQYPNIDWQKDVGFTQISIDYLAAEATNYEDYTGVFAQSEPQKATVEQLEQMRQAKKEHQEKVDNFKTGETGVSTSKETDDYYITFVFNNNAQKHEFMEKIGQPRTARTVRATLLWEIYEGKFEL